MRQRRLLRHGVEPVTQRTSVTSVLRLPAASADKIHARVRALPDVGRQYVYPAGDLHLTLLNLDGVDESAIAEVCRVIAATRPVTVQLSGLHLSAHSVYVRAVDQGWLHQLRRQLIGVTGSAPPWPLRLLGFVNVLRWLDPDLGALRNGLRRVDFGTVTLDAVEVVRTDRMLSQQGTTLLRRIELTG